jgi:hypothetical protein
VSRQRIRIPQGRPIDLVIEMDDGSVQVLEAAKVVSVDKRSTCPDVRLEGQRWAEERPAKGQEPKPQEPPPKAKSARSDEDWFRAVTGVGGGPFKHRTAEERARDTHEWARQYQGEFTVDPFFTPPDPRARSGSTWSNRPTPEQDRTTAESFRRTMDEVYRHMQEAQEQHARDEARRWAEQVNERARQRQAPKPPPTQVTTGWRTSLGYQETDRPTLAEAQKRHRSLMAKAHPDAGGTHEQAVDLNRAMDQARHELGVRVRM